MQTNIIYITFQLPLILTIYLELNFATLFRLLEMVQIALLHNSGGNYRMLP